MRIQCPSCSAIYAVAAALLEKPRTVRCARCGTNWTASRENALPDPEPQPEPPIPIPATAVTNATDTAATGVTAEARAEAKRPTAANAEPPADLATKLEPPPEGGQTASKDAPVPGDAAKPTPVAADVKAEAEAPRGEPVVPVAGATDEEPLPAEPPPLASIEGLSGQVHEPRDRLLTPAWIASFAAIIAVLSLCYVKRVEVMQHWPASKRIYALIGLAPHAQESGQ